jgi:hypothetical protein
MAAKSWRPGIRSQHNFFFGRSEGTFLGSSEWMLRVCGRLREAGSRWRGPIVQIAIVRRLFGAARKTLWCIFFNWLLTPARKELTPARRENQEGSGVDSSREGRIVAGGLYPRARLWARGRQPRPRPPFAHRSSLRSDRKRGRFWVSICCEREPGKGVGRVGRRTAE